MTITMCTDGAGHSMTLVARVIAMHSRGLARSVARRFAWHRKRRSASTQWMLGISAVVAAATLFLTSALSLGVMLDRLRTEMRTVEHTQAIVLQIGNIEDDLNDAKNAARHYLASGDRTGIAMVRIEGRNATRRLQALTSLAPADAVTIRTVTRQIDEELATLAQGRDSDVGTRALAAFHRDQDAAYLGERATVERHIVNVIAVALLLALVGPALGLIGITLLQRDRGRRQARQLQSELMHVQRLAVMGETAAMLAHEVSHPLTAASNYLAVLKRTADQGDLGKVADFSQRAATQIHRAATILNRLRRFIEKRDSERASVAPAVLIEDAVALLGPLDGDVDLSISVDPALPDVTIDRIQIQQVLVNLIRNAIEAMRGSDSRRLAIAARIVEQRWVEFTLADTGCGLSPDIAARLFRPFVTTKSGGMGVGLSICRSIIASHGGTIWAEPNALGGTVFHFRLPAA